LLFLIGYKNIIYKQNQDGFKQSNVKFFRDLKERLNHWFLKQSLKRLQRQKRFFNYAGTSTIGILYDASTEEQYLSIANLVKELQQDQKKVKALGYVLQKKLPEHAFPKLTFEFCNYRNFNWALKPVTQNIKDFISKDYDILIDLTPSGFYQVKRLVADSPAHFKVGRYAEKFLDLYDLMIQIDDQTPLTEAIKHTFFYLKMINNNDQGDDQ
jgi:hypothetical protein